MKMSSQRVTHVVGSWAIVPLYLHFHSTFSEAAVAEWRQSEQEPAESLSLATSLTRVAVVASQVQLELRAHRAVDNHL